ATATPKSRTLSLHDALPILATGRNGSVQPERVPAAGRVPEPPALRSVVVPADVETDLRLTAGAELARDGDAGAAAVHVIMVVRPAEEEQDTGIPLERRGEVVRVGELPTGPDRERPRRAGERRLDGAARGRLAPRPPARAAHREAGRRLAEREHRTGTGIEPFDPVVPNQFRETAYAEPDVRRAGRTERRRRDIIEIAGAEVSRRRARL